MKILKSKIEKELNIRTQKDYPIEGIEFIDIMPLIMQADVYQEITELLCKDVKQKDKVNYIVSPEARGFLFGCPVAHALKLPCIPVRKKGKLPPDTVEIEFEYEKEYGKDKLCLPKLVNDSYKGKTFYIVDDIYATGNTVKAIKKAIEELGGNVVGTGVVMNIVELNNEKDIFSIIDVNED